jgi:hypothetical protein
LREWAQASDSRPSNPKELFNLRHSALRNIVERVFGVAKRKFKILRSQPEYPLTAQIKLVLALACVTNIIHSVEGEDMFDTVDNNEDEPTEDELEAAQAMEGLNDWRAKDAAKFRDDMAQQMWIDYQNYLAKEAAGST